MLLLHDHHDLLLPHPSYDPFLLPENSKSVEPSNFGTPARNLTQDLTHPAIIHFADLGYYNLLDRRMSSATADSDASDVQDAPSVQDSLSPTPDPLDPAALPDDPVPAHAAADGPRVQLPSIFHTMNDSFRQDHRRASLPDVSFRSAASPSASSALSSYQFPPSEASEDVKPRIGADSSPFGVSYDHSSHPSPSYSFAPSSQLASDYAFPRSHAQALPSLQLSAADHWSQSAIVRPSSTPSSSHNLKYEAPRESPAYYPAHHPHPAPMYPDRRPSYSSPDTVKDEWSFPPSDYLAPSSASSTSTGPAPSPSPNRSPVSGATTPSSLVERPQKKRGKLPKPTTDFLKDWLHRHSDHPYPSEEEKKQLCAATGLSMSQVSNWMINARRRILAPVHRPSSGPSTTHPLSVPRTSAPNAGVSTGTLLRRASMPTDSMQLYHPLSLQSLSSHGAGGSVPSDPYYASSRNSVMLSHTYGGGPRSSPAYSSAYAQPQGGSVSGYSFPGPSHHHGHAHGQSSYVSSGLPMSSGGSYSGGSGGGGALGLSGLSVGSGQGLYAQQQHQQYLPPSRDHHSSPGSNYHTPQ
ncbi:hypothetical protein OF83DRAFT_1120209 [Amylostereum chailletii]|nr:hypothetical protein OF83DRAFT_1120209 [Amylostereum chailletii]